MVIAAAMFAALASAQNGAVPPSFSGVARSVEPAVVSIEAKGKLAQPVTAATPQPGTDEDVMDFFRRQMPKRPSYSLGSGFIVNKMGYIVTNYHVVDDTAAITVKLDSGEEYAAKIVGVDPETDIAVLKVDAGHDLPFVKFGDSDKLEVGDWVLAMGSPFGLAKSVSAGIISQTQRDTPGASAFQRFIQTDAVINPGNSGGPLVNMSGEVIGVNSQIATQTGEFSGVGFALPSAETQKVYDQIIADGRVRRGYLGAYLDTVKSEFAKVYGLPRPHGAFITDIRDKQSPAALAGLKTGDIIMEFNGQPVDSAQDLIAKVSMVAPDRSVNVVYYRENGAAVDRLTTTVKLGERPSPARIDIDDNTSRRTLPVDGSKPAEKPFGLTLAELTPVLSATYKLDGQKGLVIRDVNMASYVADVRLSTGESALRIGDLIERLNRQDVTTLAAFQAAAAKLKPGDPVVLHIAYYNPALQTIQRKIVQFTVK